MKKVFIVLVIAGIVLGLTGMSQAKPNSQAVKPLPATDVRLVKKVPSFLAVEGTKDRPSSPPGQNKDKGGNGEAAATGVLGELLAEGASKYAVVIGICDYPDTINDICWADGDSLNMYEALVDVYGYNPDNIYLFRDMAAASGTTPLKGVPYASEPATFNNIAQAVATIATNTSSGDEIVFFFSGHGADGIAGDNDSERRDEAIVVHDGNKAVYLWDGQLREWFSNVNTSRIALVFDSCLAGGMDDVASEGRVVAMATEENQVAYVYSKGVPGVEEGEGVFSHYFVNEGVLQGLADKYDHTTPAPDDEGKLEPSDVVVEEAFDYAKEIIPGIWKRQKPTISDKFADDLLL